MDTMASEIRDPRLGHSLYRELSRSLLQRLIDAVLTFSAAATFLMLPM
jgi:hypothetical protein